MDISGYLFDTEDDAKNAITLINQTLGIPKDEVSITQSYTNYEIIDNKIFIMADDTIISILGEPQFISINIPTNLI